MYVIELGGEDDAFAAREAASAAAGVAVLAPGLALAERVDFGRAKRLAYTHRASRMVGRTDATLDGARALLDGTSLDIDGTVAVRARDVRRSSGIDTRTVERKLGEILTAQGYTVDLDDPDNELRALFAGGTCVLGWLAVESERKYGARAPTKKPFFQPGSMDPLLARALATIAGAQAGSLVVDPMCGTGGVLVEAGLIGSDVIGFDAQSKMVRGARENLAHYLDSGYTTARADATHLPLADDAVDGVVFDAPYGRQSKIQGNLDELVAGALAEANRIAPRAVVVGDRLWKDAARAAGWIVEETFERRVHRSLTRHIAVLESE